MHKEIALNIESDIQRQKKLSCALMQLGFDVHNTASLEMGKDMIRKQSYRLILINSDTVKNQVLELCCFIRNCGVRSILIVIMDKIKIQLEEKLFDCGVNDVVAGQQTMPRVLAKRIKAHLNNTNAPFALNNTVRLKDTVVDFERREVLCNGTIRELPGILSDLLRYFIDNPNRVISRDELAQSPIWADSICSSANEGGKTFDVNIGKLRKIIEPDSLKPEIITSVRGVGWKLACDIAGKIEKIDPVNMNKLPENVEAPGILITSG